MKKVSMKLFAVLLAVILVLSMTACDTEKQENKVIRISTTTSVNDSGLLDYLQPIFEEKTGYKLEIASAGTGKAIEAAKLGNADLILVHSKSQEEAFVSEGFSRKLEGYDARISFMYNYFVIVGGNSDPASIKNSEDAKSAFAKIFDTSSTFISRGDKSGTHTKEIAIWKEANHTDITVDGYPKEYTFYQSIGQGMGNTLIMANEKSAYTLSDKATFLSFKKDPNGDKLPNLTLLLEKANDMKNTYSMIAVDKKAFEGKDVTINEKGADIFIKFMIEKGTLSLIDGYGVDKYGEQLFFTTTVLPTK